MGKVILRWEQDRGVELLGECRRYAMCSLHCFDNASDVIERIGSIGTLCRAAGCVISKCTRRSCVGYTRTSE